MPYHQAPAKYTGELFGVKYLNQEPLSNEDEDEDSKVEVDEGLGDESCIFPSISEALSTFDSPDAEADQHNEVHECMHSRPFILCHLCV